MNYKPFIGFWFYGAATTAERVVRYVSWGLKGTLPEGPGIIKYLRKLLRIGM